MNIFANCHYVCPLFLFTGIFFCAMGTKKGSKNRSHSPPVPTPKHTHIKAQMWSEGVHHSNCVTFYTFYVTTLQFFLLLRACHSATASKKKEKVKRIEQSKASAGQDFCSSGSIKRFLFCTQANATSCPEVVQWCHSLKAGRSRTREEKKIMIMYTHTREEREREDFLEKEIIEKRKKES